MVSIAMADLPVCRSPRISSRWPRPIGIERIDDDEAGLQGHRDQGAVHDRPGRALDGQALAGGDRPPAVEWATQGIDDAPDQAVTHRHVHHATRTLDLVARVQMLAFAEEHDADLVRIDVERDAVEIAGKLHQLIEAHAREGPRPWRCRWRRS